jgi:uncharacterized repeat protein (TIGR02543 family)
LYSKQNMNMSSLYQTKSTAFRSPNNNISSRFLILLLCIFFVAVSWGQVTISPGGNYSQNFNSIGTSATASLPLGWMCEKVTTERSVVTAYSALTSSVTANALTYNTAMSSTATNGFWNFGGGVSSGDQSVGGISSASASKSVNYYLKLTNSSSTSSISSFTITYKAERYRNGSNVSGSSIRLYYSTTGLANSWTEIASGIASFSANADNNGSTTNPMEVVSISNVALSQSLAANGSIYFAWSYSITSGSTTSNAQALGIDDVLIQAVTQSYSVTFNSNTGSGSMANQTASSATALTSNTFTKTGYTFAGWNTASDGTGTSYADGANYPFSSSTTLYAQWAANSLSVTYDTQGGSSVANGTTTTGGSIASSPGTPTKNGFSFNGWFAASSGGNAITFPYAHGQTSSFTLYAQWTCNSGTYTGASGGNWSEGSNWCWGSVPTSASNVTIPSGVTVTLDATTTTVASLTIDGTLEVAAGKQLTVIGTLTNNGTFLLHDGATFVQGASGTSIEGTGTFTVEKELSGNNSTWSSTSGRFWYMGVPMVNVARSSFGSYAAGTNRVWSYAEATKLYTDITDNTATLNAGTGYVHRRSANGTLTFSANGINGLYRTDVSLPSLTRTAGASAGYHLISNPYMAYLDWDAVIAANGTTNIESTYYIRSAEPSNNNALISYNSNGPNYVSGGVTSIDQLEDVQYIAPMQSIWVRVGTASATGSLVMNRGMLSHQSNNPGLKNTSIFPTSARVNLVDGSRFDQILVFMNQDMSNGVDQFDSEKMFVNGAPQIYTMASNKKLVMNGLKNNKKKISVPLYLELPESKVYNLQLTEYILEDGLILLEDKQEGTIQDFTINNTYAFYANSGVLSNRFVLHFYMPDAGVSAQGPSNSWVEEETSYVEGGDVFISSDSKGKIQITLDQPVAENITGLVQATDVNGKIVFTTQLMGLFTEFQMNVPSGIYYLSVQNGNIFQSKKVFVQN